MKNKICKKIVVVIIAILIFSLFLGIIASADDNFKNLRAWFGNISIYRNNQQVHLVGDDKPFIIDGRTYVPLRVMANIFNKEVGWNGANYRIDLNDKPGDNLIYLTQQLTEAQTKVRKLETEVAQLEKELADRDRYGKRGNIRELESYLNRQHGTYKKIEFDINLYEGKKDTIEVDIYVDLDYYEYEWDKLSKSNKKSYLQDIADDILYDYKNADVEGLIMDSSTSKNKTLVSFYTKSNGTVVVDTDYEWDSGKYGSLYDLEDDLNDYYNKHEGVYFDIELYGDKDDIRVYVVAEYDDLYYLGKKEIKKYLQELYDEIIWAFPKAYVDGYIEDDYTEYYFSFDKWGDVYLD